MRVEGEGCGQMIHRNGPSKLRQNVTLLQYLVILLTCQVLIRPWVLADIIKAYLCGIYLICVFVKGPETEKDQRAFRFPVDLRSAIESWQEFEMKPMGSASAVPLGAEPSVSGMLVPCGVSLKLRCCGLGRWKNAAPHFKLVPRMDCESG